MSAPLVLSLFPGADLFGMAFESEGFCVVQGPDIQFGRDIHDFHPPAGKFDGVIGGPPCQHWSRLRHLVEYNGYARAPDLIPEYERCIAEAAPRWFVMENVPEAPVPSVAGYEIRAHVSRKADACWTVPMIASLHRELHRIGIRSFEARYDVDLKLAAIATEQQWLAHLARA